MNVDFVRNYCLTFPKSRESLQWGETLCFKAGAKVGGKIFAMLSLDAVPPSLTLKTTPERFLDLIEIEGIVRARYVGRYHWITLERLDVLSLGELKALISSSYELIAAKLPAPKPRKRRL
jgi:predicted DNA-binding protein (MmcQ/YjbR family)